MEDHSHAADIIRHALGLKPRMVGKLVSSTWIAKKYESKQYCFPKSRKKRIRDKWAKDKRNFRDIEVHDFFVNEATGIIYGHPDTIRIINYLKEYGRLPRR